jgi:predicted MPP superfamily phosphohydrolase
MSTLIQNLDLAVHAPKSKTFTWIHISDLHFRQGGEASSEAEKEIVCDGLLADAQEVTKQVGPPDAVFVTGDVAFKGNSAEYDKATEWLAKMASVLSLTPSKIYVVPGNHDVDRRLATGRLSRRVLHEHLRKNPDAVDELLKNPDDLREVWPKLDNYSAFASRYGSPKLSPENPFWRVALPSGVGKISLVGLNTALLSYDANDSAQNLSLGHSQLYQTIQQSPEEALLIVLQHHPPEWLRDGGELETMLQRHPHIVLCGHTHSQKGLIISPLHGHGLVRLVAGAGYSDSLSAGGHSYSWGRISAKGLEYMPRIWVQQSGEFRADRNAHDSMDSHGIVLIKRNQLPKALSNWLPVPEPILIAGVVKWINDPKGQWRISVRAKLARLNEKRINSFLEVIRELSQDVNVTLEYISEGSVTFILRGSDAGFDRLNLLLQKNPQQVARRLGFKILELARVNGAVVKAGLDFSGDVGQEEFSSPSLLMTKGVVEPYSRLRWVIADPAIATKHKLLIAGAEGSPSPDAEERQRLANYFKAGVNITEDNMWVNLSAYESKRMVPAPLANTEMGRDLLATDCMLKRLAASLIHPDHEVGRKFWSAVIRECGFGQDKRRLPLNTFQKIWIQPEKAVVYEDVVNAELVKKFSFMASYAVGSKTGAILESRQKVLCEEDSFAIDAEINELALTEVDRKLFKRDQGTVSRLYREIVLPEIVWEVNESSRFIRLRQVMDALILAAYIRRIRAGHPNYNEFIGVNQPEKLGIGIDIDLNAEFYAQYMELFTTGLYRSIKTIFDTHHGSIVHQTYFAGAINMRYIPIEFETSVDAFPRLGLSHEAFHVLRESENRRIRRIRHAASGAGGVG